MPVAQSVGGKEGDEWGAHGRDGFHDLSGRERTGEHVALHDVGEQRVQRNLQDGVAYSQEDAGEHTVVEIERDERNNHPDDGDDIAELHGLFASDFVHERGGGDAEQQEPDENHGRNEPCESLAQVEFLFRIGCQRAHDINKAHDEKAEQHGQDFG